MAYGLLFHNRAVPVDASQSHSSAIHELASSIRDC